VSYTAPDGSPEDWRDSALAALQESLQQQEQYPESALKAATHLRIARLYRDHQQFEEALKYYHTCRAQCAAVDAPLTLAECLIGVAHTKWTGNPDRGSIALLDEARRLAEKEGPRGTRIVLDVMDFKSEILREEGRLDEALKAAREGRALAERSGSKHREATLAQRTVEVMLLQEHDLGMIEQAIAETEGLYRESGGPEGHLNLLDRDRGKLCLRKGEYEQALAYFRDCLRREERFYVSRHGIGARLSDIGRCHERMGDAVAALAYISVAKAIWDDMGETSAEEAACEEQRISQAHPHLDEDALRARTTQLKREHASWLLLNAEDQDRG
jgi:tetratricopeptide (TPR) repeat protein